MDAIMRKRKKSANEVDIPLNKDNKYHKAWVLAELKNAWFSNSISLFHIHLCNSSVSLLSKNHFEVPPEDES